MNHPGLQKDRKVIIVEDQLFFYDPEFEISFHKKKLVLHRASMKSYNDLLISKGYEVIYLEYAADKKMNYLFGPIKKLGIDNIILCDPVDYALEERLVKLSEEHGITITIMETPSFINSREDIKNYFSSKKNYRLTSFYIHERKRLKILLDGEKPVGRRWTFDKFNRKKMSKGAKVPEIPYIERDHYVKDAVKYVLDKFPNHPGDTGGFIYPTNHQDANLWFKSFIKCRLENFGDYQDAIDSGDPFLYHSLISSSLNIGLLTPQEILDKVLVAVNIPINSKEGFIRQIIGWREFLRAIYVLEGVQQRTSNHFHNEKEIPVRLWRGQTGLLPYDNTVKRIYDYAYAHHIERLMIIGNLMLLLDINPDMVYKWFMELFIDAYDWVMVPNVYGMSQYADGGLITSKPYVSSSNYLKKMSNYKSGNWTNIWDSLYWNFLSKNRDLVEENPRMALLKRYLKDEDKIKLHIHVAEEFINIIFNTS